MKRQYEFSINVGFTSVMKKYVVLDSTKNFNHFNTDNI